MKSILIRSVVLLAFGIIGCENLIGVEDISEKSVSILAPTQGVVIKDSIVSFNWEQLEGADSYRVQIAQPAFDKASQILLDSLVSDLNYKIKLSPSAYQWRVRGENSAYESVYEINSFEVRY